MPIINGVEVEGCKYFLNNEHKTCGEGLVDCEGKDCLYKQFKRLEKENELLRQGIKHYQRGIFSIISIATECRNNKKWNYKKSEEQ